MNKFEETYKQGAANNMPSEVPDMFDSIISKSNFNSSSAHHRKTKLKRNFWICVGSVAVVLSISLYLMFGDSESGSGKLDKQDKIILPVPNLEKDSNEVILEFGTKERLNQSINSEKKPPINSVIQENTEDIQIQRKIDQSDLDIEGNGDLEEQGVSESVEKEEDVLDTAEQQSIEKSDKYDSPTNDQSENQDEDPFDVYLKKHPRTDTLNKLFKKN